MTHKFGGTSVANAERYAAVAQLMLARSEATQVIVVSAMSKVTDALISLGTRASAGDGSWRADLEALQAKHREAATALLGARFAQAWPWFDAEFSRLRSVLETLALFGGPSSDGLLFVQGLGEVLSAKLLTEHFALLGKPAAYLDAREVLVVHRTAQGVQVDWPTSQAKFDAWVAAHPSPRLVVTGFVARDEAGRVTTLGRNGSDYSGAIFGALSGSRDIHIWTDVDGVLSADPRLVPEAVFLPQLSYAEACELAYFGAKVIHPQTMAPAIARNIPLRIRNTFNPTHEGSRISATSAPTPPVKGLTTIGGLALVNVEGAGMIGVPGTAERVFGSLHRAGISVVMISQGSSEHSVCCVVEAPRAQEAVAVLRAAFPTEQIQAVTAQGDISVLAVVGDGMAGTPGIAAQLFSALARAQVNVRAIAQGSSERNISVAISSSQAQRALRAVHAGFYLSPQTLSVGVIGPGKVGQALLGQLFAAQERLSRTVNLELKVRAVAGSRSMALDELGLSAASLAQKLAAGGPTDLAQFAAHVGAPHLPHAVILDCSASPAVAALYAGWLAAGIHVITPNKQAGSGPLAQYQAIREATRGGGRFRYEATVGAGLPVLSTLKDLLDTGDTVHAIEGMLSGTLAWLFNRYDGKVPFSTLVEEARGLGYTEPDPRDDLSGTDVARKLVILGRELGAQLSLENVTVESLVPKALREGSKEDFLRGLSALDAPMLQRLEAARAKGRVLRYVARVDKSGTASVGLMELERTHAFANAQLTDNVVQFTTERYRANPLVVQGPGAGPEVTAAGVFADLLRVAAFVGARL